MACEDIEEKLKDLRAEKKNLKKSMDSLTGQSLLRAQKELAQLEGQIAIEEINLDECKAIAKQGKNPTPRPFVGHVKEIFCAEASSEVGEDEPYLIITSVDMLATLNVGPLPVGHKPSVHSVKIGPWLGVKAETWHRATSLAPHDNPAFWDLDGHARVINSPHDVIFLVSVVENDGSSPDAIRGAVETAVGLSVVQNLNRAYDSLATTLASAMTGAIDTASLAGLDPLHLNADDRIGNVHQLRLTTDDIDRINAVGKLEKSLSFQRKKKSGKVKDDYTVKFSFEA